MHEGKRLFSLGRFHRAYRVRHGKFARMDGGNFPLHPIGHHDLVDDNVRFLHGADDITGFHLIAHLYAGLKPPFAVALEGGHLHAAG